MPFGGADRQLNINISLQIQRKSTPTLHHVLHRCRHRCVPCISHIIVVKPQLGQDRRARLEGMGDGFGTLVPDLVVVEGQGGQRRVDLQRLHDRDGSLVPNLVASKPELGQDRVDLQRLRDCDGSLWTNVVVV